MRTGYKVLLSMFALYVIWGTTYLGIKVGLEAGMTPTLSLALRLLPASLILLAVARIRGSRLRLTAHEFRVTAVVGILLLVGGQYLTYVAEQWVASGLSALVVALLPLWIALAESVFPDMRRPGRLGWTGLVVGFTGLAILMWPRISGTGVSGGPLELAGAGLQVLATWLWSSGTIYSKRNPLEVDRIVMTAYQMAVAGVVVLAIGTLRGEWSTMVVTPTGLTALAYLTLFGSCLAFTAFGYALTHLPASKVMTYAYVNPVIAVFAGWLAGTVGLVPPEPVTPSILVGMTVIVAGVALTTLAPTLPPRRAVQASAQG